MFVDVMARRSSFPRRADQQCTLDGRREGNQVSSDGSPLKRVSMKVRMIRDASKRCNSTLTPIRDATYRARPDRVENRPV